MAESRAKRMQVVAILAKKQEDAAANSVNLYRTQITQEQRQLQDLCDYAEQYLQAQSVLREGVLAHELINYSSFINRLNEACREQEAKVMRMGRQLQALEQQWRVKQQKRKSIEELIQRLQQEDNLLADKLLQKELDELSAQQQLRQRDTYQNDTN